MQSVDYLIIGQGLAGSVLAALLLERGRSFIVVDDNHRGAASKVAAGVINPITGKRLNRPTLIGQLLREAFSTVSGDRTAAGNTHLCTGQGASPVHRRD